MSDKALTYAQYLKIDELLELSQPQSSEHDEPLFIAIHQVYELWFKQILWEISRAQRLLEDGDSFGSLGTLGRIRTILKTCVSQLDILETMTPLQFNSFRDRLTSGSGFQSAQFRELEAVLGRRDHAGASAAAGTGMGMSEHLVPGSLPRARVEKAMARPSVWDSTLRYLAGRNHDFPAEILERDVTLPYGGDERVQATLLTVHRTDPEAGLVCEALVDIDEGLQEWRYRHVKMVERTIGNKSGTGGSSGVGYLSSTLFHSVFPDLWAIRTQF
jgi:tryptophan 2,3-dioxygenase